MRFPAQRSGHSDGRSDLREHRSPVPRRAQPTGNSPTLPLLPGGLSLPLVVKPRASGSSAGVAIVRTHEAWSKVIIETAERTPEVLVEEFVPGREFSCGVLGEDALPVVEIVSTDEFYSYDAKYKPGGSRHLIPAPIDHDLTSRLQTLALSVHRLIGLRDCSRRAKATFSYTDLVGRRRKSWKTEPILRRR